MNLIATVRHLHHCFGTCLHKLDWPAEPLREQWGYEELGIPNDFRTEAAAHIWRYNAAQVLRDIEPRSKFVAQVVRCLGGCPECEPFLCPICEAANGFDWHDGAALVDDAQVCPTMRLGEMLFQVVKHWHLREHVGAFRFEQQRCAGCGCFVNGGHCIERLVIDNYRRYGIGGLITILCNDNGNWFASPTNAVVRKHWSFEVGKATRKVGERGEICCSPYAENTWHFERCRNVDGQNLGVGLIGHHELCERSIYWCDVINKSTVPSEQAWVFFSKYFCSDKTH